MCLTTLFVDMDAYFASVEQQENPHLRRKAIAVIPVMADTSCCIAASYEAKRHGIKTGTRVSHAKQLCPKLQLVPAKPDLYVRYHHTIIQAVESCLPISVVCSIDEMACRLMGVERNPRNAVTIAEKIKTTIRLEVGEYVRCSIGIGPNRFLAKVASDMQKPDGLVIVTSDQLPQCLYGLKLTDLPGIACGMHARLQRYSVETVQQLCALSKEQMYSIWHSVLGKQWWHWLRGHDLPDVPTRRRTLGHSHVLPPRLRSRDGARSVLVRLIHRAAARLRGIRYWAQQMDVKVVYIPHGRWKARAYLGQCQDTLTMLEAFSTLWERSPANKPLRVGITLFDLVPDRCATLPLFDTDRKRRELAQVMDRVNTRFGTHSIYWAGMHGACDTAPVRISFTSIPTLKAAEM